MDRQIIYPGQIPLDTDLLNTNKNAMVALGKLAGAALGTTTVVNGLAVTPSATAMNVAVASGEIYSLQNIDATTYGSLAADTTNQIVKQGILLTAISLACPAPTTAGQSINYLIQAAFSETDTGSVTLPYFNASNPTQAWSGPANAGTAQATARQGLCAVTVVAGTAAATGTQTTPAPTAGAIGLAVVTVAYGATSIVSGNITSYFDTSIVPQSGLASNVAHAIYTKSVAGNTNVTLTAQEAAYPLLTLTGAITANINVIVPAVSRQRVINNLTTGAFNVTVKTAAGTGITVPQNQTLSLYCDGVNVLNESSASLMPAPYADATGTSDAITASYAVGNPVLYDGYPLALGITTPNATTTPTFAPSLNGTAQTARTIVKYIGNNPVALNPGDLQGDAELRYDLPNTRWVLQNPSVSTASPKLPNLTGTVAANALTIGVSSQWMDFRAATLGSGAISTIFAAPANLVVPSGATLGTVNAVQSRIVVALMNNGGAAELAIANIAGGLQMDETNLITTTAISAAATAANVWYSTTARAALPYRIIGYIESTQTTAGTWAAAPSTIQGAGGNALSATSGLGYGQTWQAVTRTSGTVYYNTTGRPIYLSVESGSNAVTGSAATITVNGVTASSNSMPVANGMAACAAIIPPNASYVATYTYVGGIISELR